MEVSPGSDCVELEVEPDFYSTPIQVTGSYEETLSMPTVGYKGRRVHAEWSHCTDTSLPIEHTSMELKHPLSHPVSLISQYEESPSVIYSTEPGFTSISIQQVSQSKRSLLVIGTYPSIKYEYSQFLYIKNRRIRNLNRSEENNLLYENQLTQEILSTPNVVSMSYTHEVRNGERTGRKVLQVGVIKKLKEDEIQHPDIYIPKEIELGNHLVVPVQVVAEGKLRLHGTYKGGAQLKVYTLTTFQIREGTLGARVEENGSYCLWSCAHVLTDFREEKIGDRIYVAHHREYDIDNTEYNYNPSYSEMWQVGGHLNIECGDYVTTVYQDIAWAKVSKTDLSEEIFGIGQVRTKGIPQKEHEVVIRGGRSGYKKRGTISNTNAICKSPEDINIPILSPGRRKIKFFKMCYIEGDLGFIKGDSGSAVVDVNTNELVGIYMGATDDKTFFSAAVQGI